MFKKILLSVVLAVILTASVIGCSRSDNLSKQGYTRNTCYIISEDDFNNFHQFVPTTSTVTEEEKNNYRIPYLEKLTAGETYYIVGYTVAETKDDSVIQFWDDCGFTLKANMPVTDAIEIIESGATVYDGGTTLSINRMEDKEANERQMFFNVLPTAVSGKAEFTVSLKIKVKTEMRLSVDYQVVGSRYHSYGKNPYFDRANSVSETYATAFFEKKIGLSEINVKYLESKDFINGRYEASSLVDSVDMKVGKNYYMVLSAKLTSYINEGNGETFDLNLKLPIAFIDGTLEEAGSGSFSESRTDTEKNISVSFRIPESSEGEKNITCIVKLIPVALGTQEISIAPSAEMISILGNGSEGVKSAVKINGEEKTSEGFEYLLSDDESYYILESVGKADGNSFLIPATYNSKPVKVIAAGAFSDLKSLRTVEISEGVEVIEEGAFSGCERLTAITLPSSMTEIRSETFKNCKELKSIKIPSGVTSIGENAFEGCTMLMSITVETGNTTFYSKDGIVYYKSTDEVFIRPEGK